MLFESEKGDITIAAGGDCLLSRPLSTYREPGFLKMVEIMRSADTAFVNLEQVIVKDEELPDGSKRAMPIGGSPRVLEGLKWAGINLISCANNHSYDYGIPGVLSTLKYLNEAGFTHAGTGRTLGEARAPGYLDTVAGRVALLAMGTSTLTAGRAGAQRSDFRGRPGLNTLRTRLMSYVDKNTFDEIRRISEITGYEKIKKNESKFFPHSALKDTEKDFNYLKHRFIHSAEDLGSRYEVDRADVEDVLRSIQDARKQADWVIVSIHWHDHEGETNEPPRFLRSFARQCIESGADAFFGHGPHELSGIEVYKGKPIFYSLANFACQIETVDFLPAEVYEAAGLGPQDRPSTLYDVRTQKNTMGWVAHPEFWQSILAVIRFEGWRLRKVELHPLDFGFKGPRTQRGRPLISGGKTGRDILAYLTKLSAPFGTKIEMGNGIGFIRLDDKY